MKAKFKKNDLVYIISDLYSFARESNIIGKIYKIEKEISYAFKYENKHVYSLDNGESISEYDIILLKESDEV